MGFKSTPAAIGTSNTDVFTMGAGLAGAIVLGIGNQTSNAIAYTVKIFKMATGVTTTIVTSQSLAGNQFKKFEVPIALEAGDKVIMTAASTGIVAFATVTDSSVAPVAKGYTPRGNYSSIATYALNDVVTASDGGSYISTEDNNLGNDPTSSPTFWMVNAEKGDIGTPGDTAMSIVRVVATTNITIASALEDGDTVDGVTLATNDLVLLAGQTAPAENGVYVVPASGAASRHASFNTYDAHCGRYFSVMEGTVGADKLYRCTSDRGGTLGTTGLTISEFSSTPVSAPSSFTPTYFGRTTAGSTTYSTQSGSYTRVGPVVFFIARVTWTAATGTGQAAIGGLPFVASADSMCVFYYDAVSIGSGKQAVLFINHSGSSGGLYGCDAGGGASVGVSVEAAGEIRVSGFYFTSS